MGSCCSKSSRKSSVLEVQNSPFKQSDSTNKGSSGISSYQPPAATTVKPFANEPVVAAPIAPSPPRVVRKLSLRYSSTQVESDLLPFPMKSGELKKLGHRVKSWKKRYFSILDGKLQYFESAPRAANLDINKLKGEVFLEGCTLEVAADKPCRLKIANAVSTGITIETESAQELAEWKTVLVEAIRVANINSLLRGYRIPTVVQWYNEQFELFNAASNVIKAGSMFMLHSIDPKDNYVELIPVWVQESSSGQAFVLICSNVSSNTTSAPSFRIQSNPSVENTAARARIDQLEVPYRDISSIMTGTKQEVYRSPEMGANSTFFTVKTAEDTFIFEVKQRNVRNHWAICIRDVVNFVCIPLPGERIKNQDATRRPTLNSNIDGNDSD